VLKILFESVYGLFRVYSFRVLGFWGSGLRALVLGFGLGFRVKGFRV
jgi:hypothetical protein